MTIRSWHKTSGQEMSLSDEQMIAQAMGGRGGMSRADATALVAAHRRRTQPCPHLEQATGDVELIQCTTCQGNVRVKYPVHNCDVHGKCLPIYKGSEPSAAKCCATCEDNPANQSSATPPPTSPQTTPPESPQ